VLTLIICLSADVEQQQETISSLRFGSRCVSTQVWVLSCCAWRNCALHHAIMQSARSSSHAAVQLGWQEPAIWRLHPSAHSINLYYCRALGLSNFVAVNKVEALEDVVQERNELRAKVEQQVSQLEVQAAQQGDSGTCSKAAVDQPYGVCDGVLDVCLLCLLALSFMVPIS
jgi:hypothetical protein